MLSWSSSCHSKTHFTNEFWQKKFILQWQHSLAPLKTIRTHLRRPQLAPSQSPGRSQEIFGKWQEKMSGCEASGKPEFSCWSEEWGQRSPFGRKRRWRCQTAHRPGRTKTGMHRLKLWGPVKNEAKSQMTPWLLNNVQKHCCHIANWDSFRKASLLCWFFLKKKTKSMLVSQEQ